ncbi:universal stress protein [Subtercola frigoramans]|uniref:Nucleotide-binding universal stress UspA family protein n=1 Tax=Subtercola frigoramans TaxID=120298 RepID=A0ABS2L620_9MICO|nr:universal stress protein [Subtercola frigoramans]MBM7472341.1 nucleotide-binding universal stress UspA family protein [Subtercola frigoramans]
MPEQTVVGWDSSLPAGEAAEWALSRASGRGGELLLVRVIDDSTVTDDYFVSDQFIHQATIELEGEVLKLRAQNPGLSIDCRVVRGDPVTELGRFSAPSTLVVVGTHQRTVNRFRYAWSLGARLAGSAEGPVAVIPSGATNESSGVVVGIDGNRAGDVAARFAAAEAETRGEVLHVVHAWSEPSLWNDSLAPTDEFLASLSAEHQSILDQAVAQVARDHPRLAVRAHLVHEPAQWALASLSRSASLLVVGHVRRRGWSAILLGSVSHALILNIQTPTVVLVSELAG